MTVSFRAGRISYSSPLPCYRCLGRTSPTGSAAHKLPSASAAANSRPPPSRRLRNSRRTVSRLAVAVLHVQKSVPSNLGGLEDGMPSDSEYAGKTHLAPLVEEMLDRLGREVERYERVVSYWPVFAPQLEGAACAALRDTTAAVSRQCGLTQVVREDASRQPGYLRPGHAPYENGYASQQL